MSHKTFIFTLFISLFLLSACATKWATKNLTFDGLYFENNSPYSLDEVKITVEKTGAFASCSPVLKGATCSTLFPPRHYQGNPVHITWVYKGVTHQEEPFVIEPPEHIIKDRHAKVIIQFDRANQLSTKMVY